MGCVYFIQALPDGPVKIGYTSSSAKKRLAYLQTGCPFDLQLMGIIDAHPYKERDIHKAFNKYRLRGEWFKPEHEILEFIQENAIVLEEERYISPYKDSLLPRADLNQLKQEAKDRGINPQELCKITGIAYSTFCRSITGKTSMNINSYNELVVALNNYQPERI